MFRITPINDPVLGITLLCEGTFDRRAVDELKGQARRWCGRVVVDLSGITQVDAYGAKALRELRKQVRCIGLSLLWTDFLEDEGT